MISYHFEEIDKSILKVFFSTLPGITSCIASFPTVSWEDSLHLFPTELRESWCLAIWYIGSKNDTAQEFRIVTYCRFTFHRDRRSSNDFFRNFNFVLVPNSVFLGIKNLMNFFTWLIHSILSLWILHRENLYSIYLLSS